MKKLIKDNDKSMGEFKKAALAYDKAVTGKAKANKINKLDEVLEDARTKAGNSDKSMEENMRKFEIQRLNDVKDILSGYIKSKMYFYCRGLESMTKAYDQLNSIDVKDAEAKLISDIKKFNPVA